MFDLLLKGGRVVDPSTNLDGPHDIAVQDGKIARIAADIPAAEAARVVEVAGKIVTPGLIDLHAHVFEGVNRTGVRPGRGAVRRHHHRRRGQRGRGHLRRLSQAHPSALPDRGDPVPARSWAWRCRASPSGPPGRAARGSWCTSATRIMTRFLGLGFTLPQVVTMSTANPAKAVGVEGRLGSLAVGRQADISVLDLREGDWVVKDVVGGTLRVAKAVVPFVTVKKGRVFQPDWGPRPWGWEPDRVLPASPVRGGCC